MSFPLQAPHRPLPLRNPLKGLEIDPLVGPETGTGEHWKESQQQDQRKNQNRQNVVRPPLWPILLASRTTFDSLGALAHGAVAHL